MATLATHRCATTINNNGLTLRVVSLTFHRQASQALESNKSLGIRSSKVGKSSSSEKHLRTELPDPLIFCVWCVFSLAKHHSRLQLGDTGAFCLTWGGL